MTGVIGLTGGIGSGKSEVARIFSLLGAGVYAADESSKYLLDHNTELRLKLTEKFGPGIYIDSILDRKKFASIIFKDNTLLAQANLIIHPFVFKDFERWVGNQPACSYLIMETAILFESGASDMMEKSITVYSPLELRVSRVMQRDSCSREAVMERIKHQIPDEEKNARADFIIYNDDEHMLIPQVLELHQAFSSEFKANT